LHLAAARPTLYSRQQERGHASSNSKGQRKNDVQLNQGETILGTIKEKDAQAQSMGDNRRSEQEKDAQAISIGNGKDENDA